MFEIYQATIYLSTIGALISRIGFWGPTHSYDKEAPNVVSAVITYSLHCSSFLGLPLRTLHMKEATPKKGTTMETIGNPYINPANLVSIARLRKE